MIMMQATLGVELSIPLILLLRLRALANAPTSYHATGRLAVLVARFGIRFWLASCMSSWSQSARPRNAPGAWQRRGSHLVARLNRLFQSRCQLSNALGDSGRKEQSLLAPADPVATEWVHSVATLCLLDPSLTAPSQSLGLRPEHVRHSSAPRERPVRFEPHNQEMPSSKLIVCPVLPLDREA